jgi:hypothetical protein
MRTKNLSGKRRLPLFWRFGLLLPLLLNLVSRFFCIIYASYYFVKLILEFSSDKKVAFATYVYTVFRRHRKIHRGLRKRPDFAELFGEQVDENALSPGMVSREAIVLFGYQ